MTTPNPPSTAAIIQHTTFDPTMAQRISHRVVPQTPPTIQPPDPSWPRAYALIESRIRRALVGEDEEGGPGAGGEGRGGRGGVLLSVSHVGSTSVPGLPAKPVIDVDVVVADPEDEGAYVAKLVGEGWEEAAGTGMGSGADKGAGLQFILREPEWHQHRFFVCADPNANVHVFGPGCPETLRHRIFRDWLAEHPEDRDKYAAVKKEAAAATREAGETAQDYNLRKEYVIKEILDRAFRAQGLLP